MTSASASPSSPSQLSTPRPPWEYLQAKTMESISVERLVGMSTGYSIVREILASQTPLLPDDATTSVWSAKSLSAFIEPVVMPVSENASDYVLVFGYRQVKLTLAQTEQNEFCVRVVHGLSNEELSQAACFDVIGIPLMLGARADWNGLGMIFESFSRNANIVPSAYLRTMFPTITSKRQFEAMTRINTPTRKAPNRAPQSHADAPPNPSTDSPTGPETTSPTSGDSDLTPDSPTNPNAEMLGTMTDSPNIKTQDNSPGVDLPSSALNIGGQQHLPLS